MTLKPRTDIPPPKPNHPPLSQEAINEMCREIMEEIFSSYQSTIKRTNRRSQLEKEGFPFASDEDMKGI